MAMPVADSPSLEALDGLSTVLGGWSGGTFASTLLTIADFSPLSRGLDALCAISDTTGLIPHPDRRDARRQPALSRPLWEMVRKPRCENSSPHGCRSMQAGASFAAKSVEASA